MNSLMFRILVLAIAAIGAIGEAVILFHSLTDSYPYKMMTTPSARFYEIIAYIGLTVTPLVSLVASWALSRRAPWYAAAVPCALSPVAFLAILAIAHVMTGVDVGSTNNFDQTTPAVVLGEFATEVLWLSLLGSIIGAVCGLMISKVRTSSNGPTAQVS